MNRLLHIIMLLVVLTAPGAAMAAAADMGGSAPLDDNVVARLAADGVLLLDQQAAGGARRILQTGWTDGRIQGAAGTQHGPGGVQDFTRLAREGDAGGRRGFAATADDDNDGLVDEDRLDGTDNDGDGLIDEDYAAIGHAMAVWHRQRPSGSRHLETYHWTYPTLRHLLAVTATQDGGGLVDPLRLELPAGTTWQPVDAVCGSVDAGGSVFLAEIPADGEWAGHWLGVVVLDERPRPRAMERIRAADAALSLPLLDGGLTLVVASGSSRLRVVDGLLAAARLQQGMTDPVSGARVPWLPQPASPVTTAAGTALLRQQGAFGSELRFVQDGERALDLDPDRLSLASGEFLPVSSVGWETEAGVVTSLMWPQEAAAAGPLCPLGDLLNAAGPGTLVLTVEQAIAAEADTLLARRTDGRLLIFELAADPEQSDLAADTDGAESSSSLYRLSPGLLANFPNPFRFTTRISYRVPATVGEAFDLEAPETPDMEPSRAMPYSASPPLVAVSVFSLEGRSVATLHVGRQGPGQYEVNWSGDDQQGRPLPSGAYFLKLQIENWSVTKRLIFVR